MHSLLVQLFVAADNNAAATVFFFVLPSVIIFYMMAMWFIVRDYGAQHKQMRCCRCLV